MLFFLLTKQLRFVGGKETEKAGKDTEVKDDVNVRINTNC